MDIVSGTPETQTVHTMELAVAGIALSVGIPAAIAIGGVAVLGWDGIDWPSATVWGVAGAVALIAVVAISRKMGWTSVHLLDLMGSFFAPANSKRARLLGLVQHLLVGALLGVAWAYGCRLGHLPADWFTGLWWGITLWALSLLLLSTLGAVHPMMRRHQQEDPGRAALHYGRWTPTPLLLGHMVYGLVLSLGYYYLPMS